MVIVIMVIIVSHVLDRNQVDGVLAVTVMLVTAVIVLLC